MKKLFMTGIIVVCIFLFGGCQTEKNSSTVSQSNGSEISGQADKSVVSKSESGVLPDNSKSDSTKTLVVYFSRTGEQYGVGNISKGNTAIVADMIAEKTGADSLEILPLEDYYPYTYDALTEIAKQELNDNARPEIKGTIPDLSKYDTVFIGAPVWWGDWPMIMYTFFESTDLSGKKLIPFSTHEGSGLSGFDGKLSAAVPDAEVLTGLAVRGSDCQNDKAGVKSKVDEWISSLGLS